MATRATRRRGAMPDRSEDAELFRQRSRMRILIAAVGVLEAEGLSGLTPEAVRGRANVSRLTYDTCFKSARALHCCEVAVSVARDRAQSLRSNLGVVRRAWEKDIVARRIVPLEWVLSPECDTRDTAMLVKSTRVDILRNERLLTAMRAHDAARIATIHTLLHLLYRGGQIPAQRVSERTAMRAGLVWEESLVRGAPRGMDGVVLRRAAAAEVGRFLGM